ncbi:MAG TPA: energy-coupled thiamine transporter ThiT, partial [Clostridiales bacterium]|nr:energy-coupled thiamine transporter ThiT [Clostridiales bacterium]
IKNDAVAIGVGSFMVCFIRFLCHFVSGITIWASWADNKTWKAILLYSLSYNGSYMLPETILTVLGCVLLCLFLFPRLDENGRFISKKN